MARCSPSPLNLLSAHYASGAERNYVGWTDARHAHPDQLAEIFIARFPAIVDAGRGSDWLYAGWYIEMLHLTYPAPSPLPTPIETRADYLETVAAARSVRVPLPPAGEADSGHE